MFFPPGIFAGLLRTLYRLAVDDLFAGYVVYLGHRAFVRDAGRPAVFFEGRVHLDDTHHHGHAAFIGKFGDYVIALRKGGYIVLPGKGFYLVGIQAFHKAAQVGAQAAFFHFFRVVVVDAEAFDGRDLFIVQQVVVNVVHHFPGFAVIPYGVPVDAGLSALFFPAEADFAEASEVGIDQQDEGHQEGGDNEGGFHGFVFLWVP